jgi:hypothetical protein
MWSKRTLGASGYTEAQEDGVEPAHSNRTCTCSCSFRTRIADAGQHARFWRSEEQPIGRDG